MALLDKFDNKFQFRRLSLEPFRIYNGPKYPTLVNHSPHPRHVHHIKGLQGGPICVVETDDACDRKKHELIFPPNNFVDCKIGERSKTFCQNYSKNAGILVTSMPNLDTVNSLKYFTGMQNISLNEHPLFTLKPVENQDGWESELTNLTKMALDSVVKLDSIDTQSYGLEKFITQSSPVTPMKRMYSSSGRLVESRRSSRLSSCASARSMNSASSESRMNQQNIFTDINLQVFYVLAGLLQTTDLNVIKTWLITATDREKALVTDIVRSALTDNDELNIFVKEREKAKQTQIIYTPRKIQPTMLKPIPENETINEINELILCPDTSPVSDVSKSRPPTSSTFRQTKKDLSRPPTRSSTEWIPAESVAAI